MDGGPAHFDEFGFDAFSFKFLQNMTEQDGGIAAFAGAAVEGDHADGSLIHCEPFCSDSRTPAARCSVSADAASRAGSGGISPVMA